MALTPLELGPLGAIGLEVSRRKRSGGFLQDLGGNGSGVLTTLFTLQPELNH